MSGKERPVANSSTAPQRPHWAAVSAQFQGEQLPLTWREWLIGKQGRSFAISFGVHTVILAILAIPISQHLSQSHDGPVLVEMIDSEIAGDPFGDLIDVPILKTETALGSEQFDIPQIDSQPVPDGGLAANAALADSTGASGSEDGDGTADLAGAVGGYLLREPGNAVKAGRFTAFTRPIIYIGVGDKRREKFGKPGEAPQDRQPYFIVIHIRVDSWRKTYPVEDLIASVVGTDGYRQTHEEGLFVLDKKGNPLAVDRDKPVKVTKGVVQLLMRVKGGSAGVHDNIYLKSTMSNEEQNLQLVFQEPKSKSGR